MRVPLVTGQRLLVTALLLTGHWSLATAQEGSTRAGVYTAGQATRGLEVYQLSCRSCHIPALHAGPAFVARWEGRPLWELFRYLSDAMPKSEPGSLTERQYILVLAYLLELNGMPAGGSELTADSLALTRIRIALKVDSTQQR